MTHSEAPVSSNKVTFIRRMGIFLYEVFLLFAALFAVAAIPTVAFNITDTNPYYPFLVQGLGVLLFCTGFLYFAWAWRRTGQTLALKTWKVKLVSMDGGIITWRQAFIRYLVSIISLLAGGLGFFWALFSKDNSTWHGRASSTKLVRIDDA